MDEFEILKSIFASAGGSGFVVWFLLRSMSKEISDAKKTAVRAHERLDKHLESHH